MSVIGERVLQALSRDPNSKDHPGGTDKYTVDNALDFHRKTIPTFFDEIRGRSVLDFGCGPGWQAVAMQREGAGKVVGVDIKPAWIEHARMLARQHGVADQTEFVLGSDKLQDGTFDVVLSSNSFEHFGDPEAILREMQRLVRVGGAVWITFAEPWLSPYGSHMSFFTKMPWVNVVFSERTVMSVRSRYRSDGATKYEDVESGLNRMTVRRFERIIKQSGLRLDWVKLYPTKGLPLVDRIPGVREFLVSAVACRLQRV